MLLFSYSVFFSVFVLKIQWWRTDSDESVNGKHTQKLFLFFSFFFLKSIDSHNQDFVYILCFCFWFCFTDLVVKNNDGESVKASSCREKERRWRWSLYGGERNECVSACLKKEELKKMNSPSILYFVKWIV